MEYTNTNWILVFRLGISTFFEEIGGLNFLKQKYGLANVLHYSIGLAHPTKKYKIKPTTLILKTKLFLIIV
jgi:hypothetical protein